MRTRRENERGMGRKKRIIQTRGESVGKLWTRRERNEEERSLFEETKSQWKGAWWRRDALLFFFFFFLVPSFFFRRWRERETTRSSNVYIYIYTLGATNFQRRRRWRQHLKLHARQINRPLFRKAKCYSRIVLGETLLLIFKFEDGKVARENGGPRIREERMGRMNEQGGDEREREREMYER